ncbi:MAG: nuclear transport factor 2 family protein [Bacteroidaceae bacterium]|nr:nuclear transport factor 2 family protein [Bacteroidaceae bacterium]
MTTEQFMQQEQDRREIRGLVDAYAYCADRRDCEGQMALFTEDTHFVVHMDSHAAEPTYALDGRESLRPVFENLNTYDRTMHFVGQHTLRQLSETEARGQAYCIAHHLNYVEGGQKLMIAYMRYEDTFRKVGGRWLFAERILLVDFTENR